MQTGAPLQRNYIEVEAGDSLTADGPVSIQIEHKSGRRVRLAVTAEPHVQVARVKSGGATPRNG